MLHNVTDVLPEDLVAQVTQRKAQGQRLVTLTCLEAGPDAFELLYHFDADLTLSHLRVRIPRTGRAPSISGVYFAALLVENEIGDHFGLCFDGLVLDWGGELYLEDEVRATPFCTYQAGQKADDSAGRKQ